MANKIRKNRCNGSHSSIQSVPNGQWEFHTCCGWWVADNGKWVRPNPYPAD